MHDASVPKEDIYHLCEYTVHMQVYLVKLNQILANFVDHFVNSHFAVLIITRVLEVGKYFCPY